MKLQYHPVLIATMISYLGGSYAFESSIRRTQVATPDEGDEKQPPHEGCKFLLNDRMDPQKMLVGAAYEETTISGYHVATEAGPTAAACDNGQAGGYTCNNIDLLSMIELSDIKPGGSSMANDIWGWTHTLGREFAIVGLREGTAFIEISDEYNPVVVGFLPTKTSNSSWRDVKTIGNYALIVSEAGNHGMQVFDLNQLLNAQPGATFSETAHYDDFGSAHNIFVNEDTEYAYAVGTNTCSGGLHIIAMNNPQNPVFAGCYSNDGYSHDVQCVVYNGPDTSYTGREICFGSNEDTITIIDVTDKNNMVQLSRKSYDGDRYTHQGWLTEDHTHFLFNDELDERNNVAPKTRTHVFEVTDLNNPVYTGYHDGRTAAIDHNLYVLGDLVYQANYRAGLNVLKIVDINTLNFEEAGYFDIYPNSDSSNFNGAWSSYPYFPSGIVVVSGIEQGLFVLKYNGAAPPTDAPVVPLTDAPVVPPTDTPVVPPTDAPVVPPTDAPVVAPTDAPIVAPTNAPVVPPTDVPVVAPTDAPVVAPTDAPVVAPTDAPVVAPTDAPVVLPTDVPVVAPTDAPVVLPTDAPVVTPTDVPVVAPTNAPVVAPTDAPVVAPTDAPVVLPTDAPVVAPTVAPVACTPCTDEETPWMSDNGVDCVTTGLLDSKCNKNRYWRRENFCQDSCFNNGNGYAGDNCCVVPTPAPVPVAPTPCTQCTDDETPWMTRNGVDCVTSGLIYSKCNKNENWIRNDFCQFSCFIEGNGYAGDNCCVVPTPAPAPAAPTPCTQCSDNGTPWMIRNEKDCITSNLLSTKCNKNQFWRKESFCQLSCFKNDLGYDGDNCCSNASSE